MSLRIGSRGSLLAMWQTRHVCGMLDGSGVKSGIIEISTPGDRSTDKPLHAIGGQGVFVKALDDAILDGTIDAGVHSMKDIPAERPEGVVTCAVLKRDSPADFMVHHCDFDDIGVVGTSSTRRAAQLLRMNPDLEIRALRGNVDTRLRKLGEGIYDGIVLAKAGIDRLGLELEGTVLPTDRFVPSPNQGAIAVVCRDDPELRDLFRGIDHPDTSMDTGIERIVMGRIGGGCFTPLGVFSENGRLIAEVLSLDGSGYERVERMVKSMDEALDVGNELADKAGYLVKEAHDKLFGVI